MQILLCNLVQSGRVLDPDDPPKRELRRKQEHSTHARAVIDEGVAVGLDVRGAGHLPEQAHSGRRVLSAIDSVIALDIVHATGVNMTPGIHAIDWVEGGICNHHESMASGAKYPPLS